METDLDTGKIYRFRVSAVNVIGEGSVSNNVKVALADPANKPLSPSIDRSLSTTNSLFVTWDEGTAGDIPISGYRLYMIEKGTG